MCFQRCSNHSRISRTGKNGSKFNFIKQCRISSYGKIFLITIDFYSFLFQDSTNYSFSDNSRCSRCSRSAIEFDSINNTRMWAKSIRSYNWKSEDSSKGNGKQCEHSAKNNKGLLLIINNASWQKNNKLRLLMIRVNAECRLLIQQ